MLLLQKPGLGTAEAEIRHRLGLSQSGHTMLHDAQMENACKFTSGGRIDRRLSPQAGPATSDCGTAVGARSSDPRPRAY